MKHLSMWLTVLLLGALPLAAAALDYGPNRMLLAVENGSAPQLPGAQTRSAATGTVQHSDVADADADDVVVPAPAAPRVSPSASSPPSVTAPRGHGPSASNKPRNPVPPQPATESGPASWRSLLPGSIQ